jgi:hypothetical protein
MATETYESKNITLIDGTELTLVPLKIKYLREFMEAFELVKTANDDEEAIIFLSNCAAIAMKQYYPKISTISELEDSVDLPTIYKILDIAAGIKIDEKSENPVKEQAEDSGSSWEKLDLAKLEAEVFLLGIWKDYEQLELSMSMPELMLTLESKREFDYQEKKFFAAIQGVDIDKNSGNKGGGNKWEEMKAKVFSGGKAANSNDVLALQGVNAQKAGFGIGMGLGYEDLTKKPTK